MPSNGYEGIAHSIAYFPQSLNLYSISPQKRDRRAALRHHIVELDRYTPVAIKHAPSNNALPTITLRAAAENCLRGSVPCLACARFAKHAAAHSCPRDRHIRRGLRKD